MSDYAQTAGTSVLNRIENDIETVKRMTDRLDSIRQRITRNSRALGYFEPPKDPSLLGGSLNGSPTPPPVVTTLAEALQQLDRAIDGASSALNVFD